MPACKAVTKGIPTLFCCWLVVCSAEQKLFLSLINCPSHDLRNLVLKEDVLLSVGSKELFSSLSVPVQTEGWVYSPLSGKRIADISRREYSVLGATSV